MSHSVYKAKPIIIKKWVKIDMSMSWKDVTVTEKGRRGYSYWQHIWQINLNHEQSQTIGEKKWKRK